ncbi:MAG: methyltransferase domain-containing protein [Bacteroidota bacterium]
MKHDICPWYLGYILANPLRRLYQNPEKIISPYCKPGMRVLEIGPGMGFFSLPMAEKVGSGGKIFCVDVQEKMLRTLRRRVVRRKLDNIIETRLCSESSLEISDTKGTIDFVLAFYVVHEIPNADILFDEIAASLRPEGILLIAEPSGHVDRTSFAELLRRAEAHGFRSIASPDIRGSHAALLKHF